MITSLISASSELDRGASPLRDYTTSEKGSLLFNNNYPESIAVAYHKHFNRSSTEVTIQDFAPSDAIFISNKFFTYEDDLISNKVLKPLVEEDSYSHDALGELIDQLLDGEVNLSSDHFFEILSESIEILSHIESINPELHSVEYLEDNSLFFTVIRGEYSIYLGQFFDSEYSKANYNSNVTIFRSNVPLPSLTGNFEDVWGKVLEIIK